jgi:uncharacterized protein
MATAVCRARSRPLTFSSIIFLLGAGVLAGALNSVAGGGAFITLPALLRVGVTPVVANATATFATWPGGLSSGLAYRREIGASRHILVPLSAVSLAGGLIGALVLVRTSDASFLRALPWLMLLAAATFTFGGKLSPRAGAFEPHARTVPRWALAGQFVIAVYGGFFGGGMGMMMLATMALAGMTNIHEMNGLKQVLAAVLNGIALLTFILNGAIAWRPGFVMMAGSIVGGYAGASVARSIDRRYVRVLVIVVAWAITAYFFWR